MKAHEPEPADPDEANLETPDAARLRELGQALFGRYGWQSALARALGYSDRQVRRWAAGAVVPADVFTRLEARRRLAEPSDENTHADRERRARARIRAVLGTLDVDLCARIERYDPDTEARAAYAEGIADTVELLRP